MHLRWSLSHGQLRQLIGRLYVLTDLVINHTSTRITFNTQGQILIPKVISRANNDTATWNGVPVRSIKEVKLATLTEKCDVDLIYLEVPSLYVGVKDPANHVCCMYISRK